MKFSDISMDSNRRAKYRKTAKFELERLLVFRRQPPCGLLGGIAIREHAVDDADLVTLSVGHRYDVDLVQRDQLAGAQQKALGACGVAVFREKQFNAEALIRLAEELLPRR